MEALLSANEDILIPPLSLSLGKGASYITGRRSATVFSSVNQASPQGVQQVKWNIASSTEWADPASVILSFDVVNDDAAHDLYPATVGAHFLFERQQTRFASSSVEDIEHYGRTCEILTRMIPAEKRLNEGALGFGVNATANVSPFDGGAQRADPIGHTAGVDNRRRVFMKLPLSGIFSSQQKYLPLWALGAGGIEISLSMAPADQATIHTPAGGVTGSQVYHLEDMRLEVDMVQIDSALQEQYISQMIEGGSLLLHSKNWNVTQVFLPPTNAGSFDVSLSKSLSRVATVFFNFAEELTVAQQQGGRMYVNEFRCYPACKETLESYLTVGAKRYPEFSNKGVTAHFWRLLSALGVAKSLPHSVNADVVSYASNSFLMGTDLEACPLVTSTGINTTGGQEIRLSVKGLTDGTDIARRCWAMIHSECIIDIKSTGAHLLT